MTVTVHIVEGATTRELRRAVLRAQQAPGEPMPGDGVTDAVHFAVLAGGGDRARPLAACYLLIEAYPWPSVDDTTGAPGTPWHLRAVAVDPARQGTGLGRVLMAAIVSYVAEHGGGVLWCNARSTALDFYRKIGFETYGEEHVSAGLDHFYMWRRVEAQTSA